MKSFRKIILCVALTQVAATLPVIAADEPEEVAVFVTIGQSNADGSGVIDEDEDARLREWYESPANTGNMKIWYRSSYIQNQPNGARWAMDATGDSIDAPAGWLDLWYRNENSDGRSAMNMIHSYGTWSTGKGAECAQGRRGIEGQFGFRFRTAFPDKELYMVKLGCSGSAIATWTADDNHNWTYFLDSIYRPAISDLLARGKKPRLAGIWWMQGCGDGNKDQAYYEPRLRELVGKCRSELGFPDAHVYIGHVVRPGESATNPRASVQFSQGVRDAQDAVAMPGSNGYVGYATIIDAADAPFQDDQLHWNQKGQVIIADRLADNVIGSGPLGWARFTTPGQWIDLDTDTPRFVPSIGSPEITYETKGNIVTATLSYPGWSDIKTIEK